MKLIFTAFIILTLNVVRFGEPSESYDNLFAGIHNHYADVSGDILVYTITSKCLFMPYWVTAVAGIPSGKVFVNYGNLSSLFFSPDGTKVLKAFTPSLFQPESDFAAIALCNTNDDSIMWSQKLEPGDTLSFMNAPLWDMEKHMLILAFPKPPDLFRLCKENRPISSEEFRQLPEKVIVYVFDLNDGKQLSRLALNLTCGETAGYMKGHIQCGGGKVFVLAKDNPLVENRNIWGSRWNIYGVDPITAETKCFELGYTNLGGLGGFFVTSSGDKIFFQGSAKGNPSNILELDTATGITRPLIRDEYSHKCFSLLGITPDGSKVCLEVANFSNEPTYGISSYNPAVLDVASGDIKILDVAPCEIESSEEIDNVKVKGLSYYAISPSGRFVIGWNIDSDIWIYDVEEGMVRVFLTPPNAMLEISIPQIPGQWNRW